MLSSIHTIADAYLKNKLSKNPDDQYFRHQLAETAQSIYSSNAGSEVRLQMTYMRDRNIYEPEVSLTFRTTHQSTYVEKVAECLDMIVGMTDAKSAAAKAAENQCLSKVS